MERTDEDQASLLPSCRPSSIRIKHFRRAQPEIIGLPSSFNEWLPNRNHLRSLATMNIRRCSSSILDISDFFLFSSPIEPCDSDRLTNTFGPFCFQLEASQQIDLFRVPASSDQHSIHSDKAVNDPSEDGEPVLALVKKRSSFKVELILEEFSLGEHEQFDAEQDCPDQADELAERLEQKKMNSPNLQRLQCPRFKPISKYSRASSLSTSYFSQLTDDVQKPDSEELKARRQLRKEKVARYLAKKQSRIWNKKISYDCRKRFADTRVRIKGRFITKVQQQVLMTDGGHQCGSSLHRVERGADQLLY